MLKRIIVSGLIKSLRQENNLTQKEFADKIGIGRTTVVGYEKGTIQPSNEIISKICEEFNVPPSAFFKTDAKAPDKEIFEELNKIMLGIKRNEYSCNGNEMLEAEKTLILNSLACLKNNLSIFFNLDY